MSELEPVRALNRGLDILEWLGERGPSSLHQIHLATGLPKSSLRRLLKTLVERRFVRVGLSDGMYRSNIATLRAVHPEDSMRIARLVEVSRPHLMHLTRQLKWPVDLHIFANNRMRIIESTHGQSPFAPSFGVDVEIELNMFVAASGLAYLSHIPESEVAALFEECRSDEFASPDRYGIKLVDLLADLRRYKKSGYAVRKTSQLRRDQRHAIAVAVLDTAQPVGAVAIAWPRQFKDLDDFTATNLAIVRDATQAISSGFIAP